MASLKDRHQWCCPSVPPGSVDGPGEVRAEDRHPAEHGHGEEVAEVAHSPAAHWVQQVGEVEHRQQEAGLEDVHEDIRGDQVAVEVVELREEDVDEESEEEEDDADDAQDGVDQEEDVVKPEMDSVTKLLQHHQLSIMELLQWVVMELEVEL